MLESATDRWRRVVWNDGTQPEGEIERRVVKVGDVHHPARVPIQVQVDLGSNTGLRGGWRVPTAAAGTGQVVADDAKLLQGLVVAK
jgi:hypothetical protein